MVTAGKIRAEYETTHYDMRPKEILIDAIGLGAGVYDRCREMGLPVRAINVGEAAPTRDNCMRLRDELWFKGREWFQNRLCSLPHVLLAPGIPVYPPYPYKAGHYPTADTYYDLPPYARCLMPACQQSV